MNTACIIQARLGSTRLPGKVLMDLGGHPVLEWVVRACWAASGLNEDEVWVATSDLPADDAVEDFCRSISVRYFRGSHDDVLDRFHNAAIMAHADTILRVTGDEPLIDPRVIGEVLALQARAGAHYCSNIHPRTYPDGLDVECFSRDALDAAHKEATRPIDRDTVTQWIVRNRSRFQAEAVINPIPGLHTERWVLDTGADLEFCRAIADRWPWINGPPSQLDILGILDRNPELRKLNSGHVMNERHFQALADEPIYRRTYDRSQAQLEKARKVIPLGAQTFSKSYLQFPQPSPLFVTHGQGGIVWDADGNEFVDLVSALLPNILGYCDPDVDVAIRRQIGSGISLSLATELEAQLAETLVRLIPCAEMVRFGKNGSDVNVAAVRIARAFTGRDKILTCDQYHGWGDTLLAGSDRGLGIPKALADLTIRINFGNVEQARKEILSKEYAAVIVEPTHDRAFLAELRSLTLMSGTVLIFDEVITGMRWHIGGAQAYFGVTPDLASFGKSLGNGLPISAIVGRRDLMMLMEPPDNIFFSSTFGGETLSLAAAIAAVKKLEEEKVPQSLRLKASMLRNDILLMRDSAGIAFAFDVDETPLSRLTFARPEWRDTFVSEMISSGTLIATSNNLCHAHTENDLRRVRKSYQHAISALSNEMSM